MAKEMGKCPKCGWRFYKCDCGNAGCSNDKCENYAFRDGMWAFVCRVCGK